MTSRKYMYASFPIQTGKTWVEKCLSGENKNPESFNEALSLLWSSNRPIVKGINEMADMGDIDMSKLQKQANTAWYALFNIGLTGYCTEDTMDNPRCCSCPEPEKAPPTCDWKRAVFLKNWLRNNGFPLTEPHVYTIAELAKQPIMGRSLPCLTQWIAQHVEAATCPDCGKQALHREQRMVCNGCDSIYPADKWANGEPCDCGCMDARYYGIHSANRLGQLEFQQCETPGCRWARDYKRLTVQVLVDAAQEEANEQWAAARTCPACGEASGNDQRNGVYLPIESCECGWQRG